mgnify:CR=1 FL=1
MTEPKKSTKTTAQKKVAPKAAPKAEVKAEAAVTEASVAKTEETAVKGTAAKTTAGKTTKAAPAKKTTAKKAAEPKAVVHFQFDGKDLVAKDILDQALKAYKAGHKGVAVKTIELYIVASEGAAYYVVNGEAQDDFKIVL